MHIGPYDAVTSPLKQGVDTICLLVQIHHVTPASPVNIMSQKQITWSAMSYKHNIISCYCIKVVLVVSCYDYSGR